MKAGWIVIVLALTACNPQEMADKAVARTAQAVITPVVGPEAALCIVEAAAPGELRAIAVDYGVEAGTSTVANIMAIARRPAAASCIAEAGITQLLR
jgi:hypothetical protein